MTEIVNKIYKEIEDRCSLPTNIYGIDAWKYHIKLQYEITTNIYNKYNADYEIVALSALLQNIALITDLEFIDEQQIINSSLAKEILLKYNYDSEKLKLIRKYISENINKNKANKEELCINDSKNMLDFYNIPYLLRKMYIKTNTDLEECNFIITNKLSEDYNNLSSIGKKIITPQYKAIKLVLNK